METGTQRRELHLGYLRRSGALQTLQQLRWHHQNHTIGELDYQTRFTRIVMSPGGERLRRQPGFPCFCRPIIRAGQFVVNPVTHETRSTFATASNDYRILPSKLSLNHSSSCADSRSVADIHSAHPDQFLLLLRPKKHERAAEHDRSAK